MSSFDDINVSYLDVGQTPQYESDYIETNCQTIQLVPSVTEVLPEAGTRSECLNN